MARKEVLRLYRRILQTARTWESASGVKSDSDSERKYIKDEARTLFKRNKEVTDPEEIQLCIKEANVRLELALHYKIPYPRPVNIPYMGLPPSHGRGKKFQDRLRKQAKPVYLHSHDENE
ncbi:LYR motif containing protein 1-like [Ptychodera flava]|uniref:LYR motif containing protein 1-like n=1 Tax=Ptychodera flava TaxID=63121 RepID=UPI003969F426